MKISQLLWLSMAAASLTTTQAGVFDGLFASSETKEEEVASLPTKINSNSIHDVIHAERRFVLYNSRRLSGECLEVCEPEKPDTRTSSSPTDELTSKPTDEPTSKPTDEPTSKPTDEPTSKPTDEPTSKPTDEPTKSPTKAPTSKPTDEPTKFPTKAPTSKPTDEPTKSPTKAPTEAPSVASLPDPVPPVPDGCVCEAGDQSLARSWKCGNDVYVCPGMTQICKNSPSTNSLFYSITQPQCDAMKLVGLGQKCVALPEYGLDHPKALSHRVCYDRSGNPVKEDGQCAECQGYIDVPFEPTAAPVGSSTEPPGGIDCTKLENLGYAFSGATNVDGCFPAITGLNAAAGPFSQSDDHVAMFVGGNFIERDAAEVEGKVVTLGDLIVEAHGAGNFVSVGAGSQIIPTAGTDCIVVGGDLKAHKAVQMYNQASWMSCDIVYKGGHVNKHQWKTNGNVRQDPSLDMSYYEDMKYALEKKSKYWKTLPSTGTFNDYWGETQLHCSDSNEIQVFNFLEGDRSLLDGTHTFRFGDACEGKTILINVHGGGEVKVNAATMFWKNRSGYSAGGFPTCMTESILWNFPDASKVEIGNGKTSEFHGSILTVGDMTLSTSGHSGRTIVLGDLTHDSKSGSEFHNYQYNPPIALPDPDDICVFPQDRSSASVAAYPTPAPTQQPTPAPTKGLTQCVAIKQKDLPSGSWATDDKSCRPCKNGQKWWPCNVKPRLCHGNCNFPN